MDTSVGNVGFSVLPKDASTCSPGKPESNLPIDRQLLFLLSYRIISSSYIPLEKGRNRELLCGATSSLLEILTGSVLIWENRFATEIM